MDVIENRGGEVKAVAILFLVLAWVSVCLRCYVRAFMMKSFGSDDWLAVATVIMFSLYSAFVFKGVEYGTGRHLTDIPLADIPIALKWWWCCELAYVTCTAILKVCIGIFLIRICVKRSQIVTIWLVMGMVVIFSIIYFFIAVFQCTPPPFFWTKYSGASGTCLKVSVIVNSSYAHAVVSCIADWTLGILPIFLVWNLAMNPRTKISVAIILALGAIGSTATLVRIPYVKLLALDDFLWNTTDVAIWSTVEPGIGITAASMATLRPLFRTFFSRSKLFGASTTNPEGSKGWPSSRNPAHAGYFRSGSGPFGRSDELGLRGDIAKGAGVTTVIKSTTSSRGFKESDSGQSHTMKRTESERELKWTQNPAYLKQHESSSEEFLPMQRPADWNVRKTTEVITSRDTDSRNGQR